MVQAAYSGLHRQNSMLAVCSPVPFHLKYTKTTSDSKTGSVIIHLQYTYMHICMSPGPFCVGQQQ